MIHSVTIPSDLACVGCEYNLRGLSSAGRCPECGLPVSDTLEVLEPDEIPGLDVVADSLRRERYAAIADATGYSIDAVMFVYDVWRVAALETRPRNHDVMARQVTAIDICAAFLEHAQNYFNDPAEALELLAEWGLSNSRDVGRIIFGMASAQWIAARPGDSEEQFDGLFTLDTLFNEPR